MCFGALGAQKFEALLGAVFGPCELKLLKSPARHLNVRAMIKGGTMTGGYGFGYVSDMYPNSF